MKIFLVLYSFFTALNIWKSVNGFTLWNPSVEAKSLN